MSTSDEQREGTNEEDRVDEMRYRAIAPRADYLAQDRVDIQLAAKAINRFMSEPEAEEW